MKNESIFILILMIIFSITLAARFQDISVTRNLDPENHPITGFEEYQKEVFVFFFAAKKTYRLFYKPQLPE